MVDLINFLRAFAFGPFLVLSFFAGAFVLWKKGKEEYYDENQLLDVFISASFWGLVGARLGFILVHFPEFGFDVLKWLSLFVYPGYLGFSGLALGLMVLYTKAKKLKWDAYEICDFGAIALTIAIVCITIGMFVNGSGFGNSTTLPIGLPFPGVFDRRHPTQLYAAVLYFLFFILLWKVERIYRTFMWYRENRRTAQTGFIFAVFWIGYGLIGLGLGLVGPPAVSIFSFSIDPILYGAAVCYGLAMLYIRSGRTFAIFLPKKKNSLTSTPESMVV